MEITLRVAYRLSHLTAASLLALTLAAPSPALAGAISDNQRSSVRTPFTLQESLQAKPGEMRDARFAADSVEEYRNALASATKANQEPWLVLSGGGENGAYAAGLLSGWSETGSRPRFSVVTGISTGALIAPLTFAGAAYDDVLKEA
jgi:hypothetical protein